MKFDAKLTIHDIEKSISKRGLGNKGLVQMYVDSEVLRLSDPYIPMDTGTLKLSGVRHTIIGSGEVIYRTPYAKKMYYGDGYRFQGAPMRGARWFERMKADRKQDILRGAAKIAGGKAE